MGGRVKRRCCTRRLPTGTSRCEPRFSDLEFKHTCAHLLVGRRCVACPNVEGGNFDRSCGTSATPPKRTPLVCFILYSHLRGRRRGWKKPLPLASADRHGSPWHERLGFRKRRAARWFWAPAWCDRSGLTNFTTSDRDQADQIDRTVGLCAALGV